MSKQAEAKDVARCCCGGPLNMNGKKVFHQTGGFVAGGRSRGYHSITVTLSCNDCGLLYDPENKRFSEAREGVLDQLNSK